jgi:hypothetical protein
MIKKKKSWLLNGMSARLEGRTDMPILPPSVFFGCRMSDFGNTKRLTEIRNPISEINKVEHPPKSIRRQSPNFAP